MLPARRVCLLVALAVTASPLVASAEEKEPVAIDFEEEFAQADKLRAAGELDTAAQQYLQLSQLLKEQFPGHPAVPRSKLIAADLLWRAEQKEAAKKIYDEIIADDSEPPQADDALKARMDMERQEGGAKGELLYVHGLFRQRPAATFADELLYRAGQILASDLNQLQDSLQPLDRLIEVVKTGTRTDDALMLRAEVYRRLTRHEDALADYRALVRTSTQSAERSEYEEDAWLLVAEVLWKDLGRPDEAQKVYLQFTVKRPESVLVDQALFSAITIAVEQGRQNQAQAFASRLRELRPDSSLLRKLPSFE